MFLFIYFLLYRDSWTLHIQMNKKLVPFFTVIVPYWGIYLNIILYLYIFKTFSRFSQTFELVSIKEIKSPMINSNLSCERIEWK
jgi:hypothetical protein